MVLLSTDSKTVSIECGSITFIITKKTEKKTASLQKGQLHNWVWHWVELPNVLAGVYMCLLCTVKKKIHKNSRMHQPLLLKS